MNLKNIDFTFPNFKVTFADDNGTSVTIPIDCVDATKLHDELGKWLDLPKE